MPFPLAYFGSFSYFETLISEKKVTLENHEHFPKQTFRNRTLINSGNGIQTLSVPVIKTDGNHTPTFSIQIDYSKSWQNDHWKAIRSSYRNAPYFEYYGVEVEEIVKNEWSSLTEMNLEILRRIKNWLELPVDFELSNTFESYQTNDPREYLLSKKNIKPYQKAPYIQVFESENSFHKNLSILDGIFCEGPTLRNLLLP